MKYKILIALALVPFISNAHAGHTHNATEILLNPSQWLNHEVFVVGIVAVFAIMIRKTMKLYFPTTYKMVANKIRSNN